MAIKRTATDFVVEEVLSAEYMAGVSATVGAVGLYTLSKNGLATPEAVGQIARELRVPSSALAAAGLKDKHASTTQHITIQPMSGGAASLPARAHGGRWRIERIGYAAAPITTTAIASNRFTVVVRGLTRRRGTQMDEAIALLRADASDQSAPQQAAAAGDNAAPVQPTMIQGATLHLVNYFGDQRFGSARHGRGFVAAHLIRGSFEDALRLLVATPIPKEARDSKRLKRQIAENWGQWARLARAMPRRPESRVVEYLAANPGDFRGAFTSLPYFQQQICVYAYQSYLWNAIARRLVEQAVAPGAADRPTLIIADDPFGLMVFPGAKYIPEDLRNLNLPVLGKNTQLIESWKPVAEAVLKDEGIASVAELKIPGVHRPFFGEADRSLFIEAREFSISGMDVDELHTAGDRRFKRNISFMLPRGGYATVLLRAIGQ